MHAVHARGALSVAVVIAALAFGGTGLQTGLEPAQGSALFTRRARDVITFDRGFAVSGRAAGRATTRPCRRRANKIV